MSEKEKLKEILQENDVRISTKGNICLNDFVENIIESKNPKLYIKKLITYDKTMINNELYIKPDDCIDILKNTNFKRCKEIYTKIQFDDNDKTSIIDVEEQIFQFEGQKFLAFFVNKDDCTNDWDVWIKGSEIAKYLDYADDKQAVRDHVDEDNKINFSKLVDLMIDKQKLKIKNIDVKTIFIKYNGLLQLIARSKKPKSIRFATFLELPILYKKSHHETEIVSHLIDFFNASNIKYKHQYSVSNMYGSKYFIDCYLTKYKIAIEIDENDHSDRNSSYCDSTRVAKKFQFVLFLQT